MKRKIYQLSEAIKVENQQIKKILWDKKRNLKVYQFLLLKQMIFQNSKMIDYIGSIMKVNFMNIKIKEQILTYGKNY